MNKYRNYVYMCICEISLVTFNKSGYVDYAKYCKSLYNSCKMGVLTSREKRDIIAITKRVELVYSMNGKDTASYILDFLKSDRCEEFKKCMDMINFFYPNSSNLNK